MVTFRYRRERSDLLGTIYRPAAEVFFKDREGNEIVCFMYVDSGADITLIPKMFGESLGLELDEKEIREIRGVGDARIPVIIKNLRIRIGEQEIEARVAWALEEVPPLLGRVDVFDRFEVEFRQTDRTIEFKPRPF